MPIYTYLCRKCSKKFDYLTGMTRIQKELKCSYCGGREADKQPSLFGIAGSGKSKSGCGTCSGGDCSGCR